MTSDTLDTSVTAIALLTCAAGAGLPTTSGNDTATAASPRYVVYALEELASGRTYVGLTRRTLEERVASHLSQARRDRRVRAGGLMAALQLMITLGQQFGDCFSARILARAGSADEARALERRWIEVLNTRLPNGYNAMPGGSSVGGVDNARPLSITWPDGGAKTYPSILAALAACNAQREARKQGALESGTVYARLAGGWSVEEALGLAARQDPRALRCPFALGNTVFTTLAAASASIGLRPATLRSRLHRLNQSHSADVPQVGKDRRARGPGRSVPLSLPWPGTNERLTAAAYAARTGVPKATVMHRWHRVRAACLTGPQPSPEALHAFMTAPAGSRYQAQAALARLLSLDEPHEVSGVPDTSPATAMAWQAP